MKKKIYMLITALIFGGIFLIGCNKKQTPPEVIPTNIITEVVETEAVGE